jgi:hypothetical protein
MASDEYTVSFWLLLEPPGPIRGFPIFQLLCKQILKKNNYVLFFLVSPSFSCCSALKSRFIETTAVVSHTIPKPEHEPLNFFFFFLLGMASLCPDQETAAAVAVAGRD